MTRWLILEEARIRANEEYLCYGLDLKCPPEAHVLKAWFPIQLYTEIGSLGSDLIMKGLILSVD
jgi:hypothetical protein